VTGNTFIALQTISISIKCCSFELSIHQKIFCFHKNIKQQMFLSWYWAANHHDL